MRKIKQKKIALVALLLGILLPVNRPCMAYSLIDMAAYGALAIATPMLPIFGKKCMNAVFGKRVNGSDINKITQKTALQKEIAGYDATLDHYMNNNDLYADDLDESVIAIFNAQTAAQGAYDQYLTTEHEKHQVAQKMRDIDWYFSGGYANRICSCLAVGAGAFAGNLFYEKVLSGYFTDAKRTAAEQQMHAAAQSCKKITATIDALRKQQTTATGVQEDTIASEINAEEAHLTLAKANLTAKQKAYLALPQQKTNWWAYATRGVCMATGAAGSYLLTNKYIKPWLGIDAKALPKNVQTIYDDAKEAFLDLQEDSTDAYQAYKDLVTTSQEAQASVPEYIVSTWMKKNTAKEKLKELCSDEMISITSFVSNVFGRNRK